MRKFLPVLTLLTCCLQTLSAQPTLAECKEKAKNNYPGIRKYELISLSEEYSLANASRAWLPQIGFSAQATYQSDVVRWPEQFESMLASAGIDMPGLQNDQYKVQLDIQQTIWDGGKIRSDRKIVESEARQERLSADVDMYAVESRVEEIFFGILSLQEQQKQIEEMMQRLRDNLAYVQVLVENGVAMQSDADAVELKLLSSNQSLSQVKASISSFRSMLEIFIGEPLGDQELIAPEASEPLGYESMRPELQLFVARENVLEARLNSVNASLMPRFSFFAQGYYGYPGLNMFENMMNRNWSLNGIVGIRVSWNISAFYTSGNSRLKLKNEMEKIAVSQDVFLFNNRMEAQRENAEIRRLRAALEDDDRIVQLCGRVREAAETRLQEGVIDMNDLLGKVSEETAAKIARSAREIELLKAIHDLKHTLNR